ncbi:7,8-didemethyl-8-hydroxy-5-deazariboflavin synthase CofG subunit [Rhodococcus sp. 27YEA15]
MTALPNPSMPKRVPSESAMRRVLRRARDGLVLDVDEATTLLHARGSDLADLCRSAARVRDAGLIAENRPGMVTYSRKVFIPLTRLCRDRCHYCTFVTVPGKLRTEGKSMFLEPDEVISIARAGAAAGCKEALFTLGDRPEARWPEAAQWLDERGYGSTLDYLRAMSVRVLEEVGLLPHLNPGVMTWEELSRLKPVAPSMGMMLETTSRELFENKSGAHHGSPDKDPSVRLRTLDDAGRLGIAFTTGILVGIGETIRDRAETIAAIRASHKMFGHIQEVIVQNFRSKPDTVMRLEPDADFEEFQATIAVARLLFGSGHAHPGAPELGERLAVPSPRRRRCRRLGRCFAGHARLRESRAPVAGIGRPDRDHRGRGLHPRRTDCGAATIRVEGFAVDRPADRAARRGTGRSTHRTRQDGRAGNRNRVAGTGCGVGVDRPGEPEHRHRFHGKTDRYP